jgi:hypothetical protein
MIIISSTIIILRLSLQAGRDRYQASGAGNSMENRTRAHPLTVAQEWLEGFSGSFNTHMPQSMGGSPSPTFASLYFDGT